MKYVFLDRDGVIIKEKHLIHRKEDVELIPGAAEAISLLNENGYKVIVITNQPAVARGLCTESELKEINDYMKMLLQQKNARIDKTYYCPHHPVAATMPVYLQDCSCRKPKPGMILQAQKDFGIEDLSQCYLVGDKVGDIKSGDLAGIKNTIMVQTGYGGQDGWKDAVPKYEEQDLESAVNNVILANVEKKIKLFISTGGKGTRLYPLTKTIPKPMVKICGKPVLHHLVDWAKNQGIKDIVMMNGFGADQIMDYFGNGEKFGINILHSNESFPLGSGGSLKYAKGYIDETFIYVSGDHLCEVDLNKMVKYHRENQSDFTALVHKSSHPHDSDILQHDSTGRIVKFVSKHEDHTGAGDLSNSGLCIIEPKIIGLMEEDVFVFETYLYPKILESGLKMMGYNTNEFMADMGTPDRLKKCEDHILKKMRVLVTGAGGMMGSHMVDFLKAKGIDVLGTYYRPTIPMEDLPKDVPLKELDVRDYREVRKVLASFKPDRIFHLAAQSYPTVSWENPQYTMDTNVTGTVNIFEAVKDLKLDPIIMVACSSAQYGFVNERDVPVTEDQQQLPLHPYGVSKVGQDLLTYQYYKNDGIKGIRIRIFNTTGPRKYNDVCSDFTKQAVLIEKGLQENKFRVGNLETRRAITDVRDAINAFWLATEYGQPGEAYNFSGEKAYLIKDLLSTILSITNINPDIWQDPKLMRPTDEKIIFGDSTKLKQQTGWKQEIDIQNTLQDMIKYWRKKY